MNPKIITRATQADTAAARWARQYRSPNDGRWLVTFLDGPAAARAVHEALVALGDQPNPDDVDRIIGNTTWTDVPPCNGCRGRFPLVVRVGGEPDYDSSTALLCPACLRSALDLVEAAADPKA